MEDLFKNPRLYLSSKPEDAKYREVYRNRMRNAFKGQDVELMQKSYSAMRFRLTIGGKSDPKEIIELCEDRLKENPFDTTALSKLGECAGSAGYHELAIYTFTDLVQICSKAAANRRLQSVKKDAMRSLGLSYYAAGKYQESKNILNQFKNMYGLDNEVDEVRKLIETNLDALIQSQQIEEAGAEARRLVKAPDIAEKLRDEGPKSEEEIHLKIDELEKILGDAQKLNSERLNSAVQASRLYKQLKMYDEAIATRARGKEFDSTMDSNLAIAELKVQKADHELSQTIKQWDKEPSEELDTLIEQKEKEKWQMVVHEYGELVGKIPTRDDLHLSLGEGCFHLGMITEDKEVIKRAITELQKRYNKQEDADKAAILLGRAFASMGIYSLAKKQFEKILDNTSISEDPQKREIAFEALYELAHVLDQTGDKEGAHETLGKIYWIDRTWRDVEEIFLKLNEEIE